MSVIEQAKRTDPTLEKLAYTVIGAAIEVHKQLGPGWLESAYEEALCVELSLRDVPFVRQCEVNLMYKGRKVGEGRINLLVAEKLIVEVKAVTALAAIHTAQVITYLRLTGCHLALLINFNVPQLRDGIERVVLSLS